MNQVLFLEKLLAYEGGAECLRMRASLASASRRVRCILRAMLLMGLIFMLALAGLAYCALLLPEIFLNDAHVVTRGLSYLCLVALISEVQFLGYLVWHRIAVTRLQEECCRLLLPLIEAEPKTSLHEAQHSQLSDNRLVYPTSSEKVLARKYVM